MDSRIKPLRDQTVVFVTTLIKENSQRKKKELRRSIGVKMDVNKSRS